MITNNILILGGGYIGSEYAKYCKQNDINHQLITRKDLDYSDMDILGAYLFRNPITHVVNCFGFTGTPNVDEAEIRQSECWSLNVSLPLKVAKLCQFLSVPYIHISSGCIYSGYDKEFTEDDAPNFGLFDNSSFYSKSKHAFETVTSDIPMHLVRIRMPISNDITNKRNYLNKIMNYPNLINYKNSKTYIPDLFDFINVLINKPDLPFDREIWNVVNSDPYDAKQSIEHLNRFNEGNWKPLDPKWVDIKDLDMIAPRSNCVLDNTKASAIFKFHTELEIMNMVCNYNNHVSES